MLLSFLLLAEENWRVINCKEEKKKKKQTTVLACSFRNKYIGIFVNMKGKRPATYTHLQWFWCRQGGHKWFTCLFVNTLFGDLFVNALFNDHSIYFVYNKRFAEVSFHKNNLTLWFVWKYEIMYSWHCIACVEKKILHDKILKISSI